MSHTPTPTIPERAIQGDLAGQRRSAPRRPTLWPILALREACQIKQVDYEETPEFVALRGAVVTCGQTAIISVSSSLKDDEKRLTLAHELGHIALGHIRGVPAPYLWEGQDAPLSLTQDKDREREADIWAAHLLVEPEVYAENLQHVQEFEQDSTRAAVQAMRQTARQVRLPVRIIKLWLKTRDCPFEETPTTWLRAPSAWSQHERK